jgi:2-isopropylmalate synthase
MSGRTNVLLKAKELGFKIDSDTPELKSILARVKELEHGGYEFEAAEGSLALLIRHRLKHEEPPFRIETYHVSMRRDVPLRRGEEGKSICEAAVKVRVGDEIAHTVAEGDGPVNALDSALRSALFRFFPKLQNVTLTDYKVRIIEAPSSHNGEPTGTAAKTRVLIESSNGKDEWGTVGVSENIIEASLQALVDSMEYALMRK